MSEAAHSSTPLDDDIHTTSDQMNGEEATSDQMNDEEATSDQVNDVEINSVVTDSDQVTSQETYSVSDTHTTTVDSNSEKKDASSLTDLTIVKVNELEAISESYNSMQNICFASNNRVSIDFSNINIASLKDDEQINFYTGLVNAKTLQVLFEFVSCNINNTSNNKLTKFQEFFLFLVRLRLNLLTQDLGYRFNVAQETASRIFCKWLDIMYIRLKKIVFWPERESLFKTMPPSFKSSFDGHVAVIIDCFEISINRPSSLKARAATWSNYKQRNTVKYLIGITPQGVISFISPGYGGRCSDKYVTEDCGILNNLLPGDVILADRGFNNLNSVGLFCARLVLPTSARGIKQIHPFDIEKTRHIASLRIHVERVIGQLKKKFHILRDLPIEMLISSGDEIAPIDKIVHVCSALVNLMPSVVN